MAELEKAIEEGIVYFKQILHVLPGDRAAQEFLCAAYLQQGALDKFFDVARDLADAVVRENDAEGAAELREKLQELEDPRAKALILKLDVIDAPKPTLEVESCEPPFRSATSEHALRAEEQMLAQLVADGAFPEKSVRSVMDQLRVTAAQEGAYLISALSILEKENLTGAADVMSAVADAAHTPPVPLESFPVQTDVLAKMPERLVKVRGVVPFAKIADEWAVALLNPLDNQLRIDVVVALKARCHFFIASPAAVERIIAAL